jgi:GNAT superfamily N-acetyltransferase
MTSRGKFETHGITLMNTQACAKAVAPQVVLSFRTLHRQEMNCQVLYDSIHRREGWSQTWLLEWADVPAGFGSMATAGPWKEKPTVFEFYLLPEYRIHIFDLFEALLAASGARFLETQSNAPLLAAMIHTYGRGIESEAILFRDGATTQLPAQGAMLRAMTPQEELHRCIEQRQGGGEWIVEVDGVKAASGGVLFHYNRPYGDIYMEVQEPFRKRGFGSYLVQELKRITYELGAVPAARCNRDNLASRRTLQKAGFVPCGHILQGPLGPIADPS